MLTPMLAMVLSGCLSAVSAPAVTLDAPVELVGGKEVHQLRENEPSSMHSCARPLLDGLDHARKHGPN